jgi:hypothetical protein
VVDQYEAITQRPLRTPRDRRHEPIGSGGPWPRPASQRRAAGPSRLPAHADECEFVSTDGMRTGRLLG